MIRVLGIDPGFANLGMALVQDMEDGRGPEVLWWQHAATSKNRLASRVVEDDVRRLMLLLVEVERALSTWQPSAMAIEAYTVGSGRAGAGAGAGAKVAMVYGAVLAQPWPTRIYRAQDRTIRIGGAKSGAKADVERGVCLRARVPAAMTAIAKTHREHVFDAAALALMALEDMRR